VRCNIVGGFDIRLLSHKETMLPCQDILTSPGWEEDCIAMLKANGYEIENETRDNAWLVRNERGCAAT
jgi:hypothetical protein